MKVKSTNKVHRNNRRKIINNLVTGTLNSFGEASIENLMDQVSNRLNRQIPKIYSAIKRSLRCGVRNGFIVKHANKFSLSGRNYETDSGKEKAYLKAMACLKEKACLRSINKCVATYKNCEVPSDEYDDDFEEYVDDSEKCEVASELLCDAVDLATLNPCKYRRFDSGKYCFTHLELINVFHYKRLFFENFEIIAMSGDFTCVIDSKVAERINEIFSVSQIKEQLKNTILKYIRFLDVYSRYIFAATPTDTALIQSIFNRKHDMNPGFCTGIDTDTGSNCGCRPFFSNSSHCQSHFILHTFIKIFSHTAQPGCGFHNDVIKTVFEILSTNGVACVEPGLEEKLTEMAYCIKLYASTITRTEDLAISRMNNEAEIFTTHTNIEKTNDKADQVRLFADEEDKCKCQCLPLEFYNRIMWLGLPR